MSTDNGLKAWPDDWPWYKQACFSSWDDRCDTLVGPCRCGAGHSEGEFEYRDGKLYRNGRTVTCYHPRFVEPSVLESPIPNGITLRQWYVGQMVVGVLNRKALFNHSPSLNKVFRDKLVQDVFELADALIEFEDRESS